MKRIWARSSALRRGAPLLVPLCAAITGAFAGIELAILVLAGGALLIIVWLLWASVQSLTGESKLSFEEAFSLGSLSVEEEQKRSVLRALKDLEYERSVGKISAEDYAEYSARYRAEAKRLIQSLDESLGPMRKRVEQQLSERLRGAEGGARESTSDLAASEAAVPASEPSSNLRICTACSAKNELDAQFCKRCGKALAAADERLCLACPARYPSDQTRCPVCGSEAEGAA